MGFYHNPPPPHLHKKQLYLVKQIIILFSEPMTHISQVGGVILMHWFTKNNKLLSLCLSDPITSHLDSRL